MNPLCKRYIALYDLLSMQSMWRNAEGDFMLRSRHALLSRLCWPFIQLICGKCFHDQCNLITNESHEKLLIAITTDFRHKASNVMRCWVSCFAIKATTEFSLQWRHNERDVVSNHQPHNCLLNRLFRRRSKKTSKLRVTGLCEGNSPGTGEFPA